MIHAESELEYTKRELIRKQHQLDDAIQVNGELARQVKELTEEIKRLKRINVEMAGLFNRPT